MVRTASLFSQLLQLVSPLQFENLVQTLPAERYAKGFTCRQQCVAMLFAQPAQAHSLREICGGLRCCLGRIVHLGIREAPKRSSLAYANDHRPWQLYQALFYEMLGQCHAVVAGRKHRLRFRNPLLSLDSSVIELCLSLFPWSDFTRTKGGVKLHCLLDHAAYLPVFVAITLATHGEAAVARLLSLPKGSIIAIDRGYKDYALFARWTTAGVFFVTRMVRGTVYDVVERRQPPKGRTIRADEIIRLSSRDAAVRGCRELLFRRAVWLPDKGEELVLLTNHLPFGATTIAAIYKERWQIELFFKALKQNLHIKTFVGTSPNALLIQIWTALIALLMLKYLQLRARFGWSLSNLAALPHWNLFTYRALWEWLNDPYQLPPPQAPPVQIHLFGLGQQPA